MYYAQSIGSGTIYLMINKKGEGPALAKIIATNPDLTFLAEWVEWADTQLASAPRRRDGCTEVGQVVTETMMQQISAALAACNTPEAAQFQQQLTKIRKSRGAP